MATKRRYKLRPVAERFWEKVNKRGPIARRGLTPCWIWTGATQRDGAGFFMLRSLRGQKTINGSRRSRFIVASRMAWILKRGPIPKGKKVLHRCDVRSCCNVKHMFLGTQLDNMRDMRKKGRAATGDQTKHVGSAHGRAKLDEAAVMEIKGLLTAGGEKASIARRFEVSEQTIRFIAQGLTWRHVRGARKVGPGGARGLVADRRAASRKRIANMGARRRHLAAKKGWITRASRRRAADA